MLWLTSSISSNFLPCCPCIIILKLEHILNMWSILDIKPPPNCALLNHWEVLSKNGVGEPVPDSTKYKADYCSRENLMNPSNWNICQFFSGSHDISLILKAIKPNNVPNKAGMQGDHQLFSRMMPLNRITLLIREQVYYEERYPTFKYISTQNVIVLWFKFICKQIGPTD